MSRRIIFDGDKIAAELEARKERQIPGTPRYIELEIGILAARSAARKIRTLYKLLDKLEKMLTKKGA